MNKKKIIYFGVTIGFLVAILLISFFLFKKNYKEENVVIKKIDEYGYAYLDNGEVVQFRGFFICNNGQEYYWENLKELVGKNLKIEYRINEEGYKKVEKFYVNRVECIKTSGGGEGRGNRRGYEEYYEE